MTILQVTPAVINAVKGLLSDASVGFNATMKAISGASASVFDFSATSKNFFTSWISPEMIAQTSVMKYPIMALYGKSSQSQHEQLSAAFSGPVQIGLDIHLSWPKTQALQDTETLVSSVESAIYTIFQPEVGLMYLQQYLNLHGFGTLAISRTPLKMDGTNWTQSIKVQMTFDITA